MRDRGRSERSTSLPRWCHIGELLAISLTASTTHIGASSDASTGSTRAVQQRQDDSLPDEHRPGAHQVWGCHHTCTYPHPRYMRRRASICILIDAYRCCSVSEAGKTRSHTANIAHELDGTPCHRILSPPSSPEPRTPCKPDSLGYVADRP